jgi:hypothetical protein
MQAQSALGQLLFETGRWDDALAEVTAMDEDLKEPGAACSDLGIAAVICFHRGETAEARQHLAAAVPHAERIGHRVIGTLALARSLDREQALEAAAAEFAQAGQRTQAGAAFAGAAEIYTALGAAADLARLRATR